MKKGILVVSFGTSYKESREKTIGAIENRIRERFREYHVYRAFTSKLILKKLKAQGIAIYNVEEAMIQMAEDGIRELIVQPTHIINGIENDRMHEDVQKYASRFDKISFGTPLLTDVQDYKDLAGIINREYVALQDEIVMLMGHGSDHYANASYPAFEYTLKQNGYSHMIIGTVEGYPDFEDACRNLEKTGSQKVCLVPMMIVAGEHASKDMAGKEDSWKSKLEEKGYDVRCVMAGLGEVKAVQEMFVKHVELAMQEG